MSMQKTLNASLDLTQMYQNIGIRRLVRFGITMGIALAGQIGVTLTLGSLTWMQQHMIFMVAIELVWWPPFFFILYLSFTGVVKLVQQGVQGYRQLRSQFDNVCQDYEDRCQMYEKRIQEQNVRISRLTRDAHEKIGVSRLEPLH